MKYLLTNSHILSRSVTTAVRVLTLIYGIGLVLRLDVVMAQLAGRHDVFPARDRGLLQAVAGRVRRTHSSCPAPFRTAAAAWLTDLEAKISITIPFYKDSYKNRKEYVSNVCEVFSSS